MPINVLHVYKTAKPFSQGGIEEVIEQLCLALKTAGVNNTILCLVDGAVSVQKQTYKGIDIIAYPMSFEVASCGFSFQLWRDFPALCKKFDLLHYQFPWPFGDLLACCRQPANIPFVVTYQSDIVRQKWWSKLYAPLMQGFLQRAHTIIATSPQYINTSKALKKHINKVTMIPNGIRVQTVTTADSVTSFLDFIAQPYILFLGVFRYYKGLHYLLEAAKYTSATIVLAGDGPQASALKHKLAAESISNVVLTGWISHKQKHTLLKHCYAFVLPSSKRSEAYGMVLLEAASYSKPLISTELGSGTSFINQHQQTGIVVPPENSVALADAINKLLANPTLAQSMGHAAFNRLQEQFSSQYMAEQYIAEYKKILENS